VTVSHLEHVFTERLRFNPGAKELITAAKAAGLTTLLVSGGFTFFCRSRSRGPGHRLRPLQHAGSGQRPTDRAHGGPGWGDICDGAEKRRTLLELASLMGISPSRPLPWATVPTTCP
jgi:phosphoserine phosphatase